MKINVWTSEILVRPCVAKTLWKWDSKWYNLRNPNRIDFIKCNVVIERVKRAIENPPKIYEKGLMSNQWKAFLKFWKDLERILCLPMQWNSYPLMWTGVVTSRKIQIRLEKYLLTVIIDKPGIVHLQECSPSTTGDFYDWKNISGNVRWS